MTFLKRAIATLSVFSVLVVGSLSFFPRSFALDSFGVGSVLPVSISSDKVVFEFSSSQAFWDTSLPWSFCMQSSSRYMLCVYSNTSSPSISREPSGTVGFFNSGNFNYTYWFFDLNFVCTSVNSGSSHTNFNIMSGSVPSNSRWVTSDNLSNSSSNFIPFEFVEPRVPGKSFYIDYSPFYFPELPYGVFDGNYIAGFNGTQSLSLNFDNLTGTSTGSFSYSESGSGSGTYSGSSSSYGGTISGGTYTGSGSLTVPSGQYGWYFGDNYSRVNNNDTSQGELYFDGGQLGTVSTSGTFTGSVSGSSGSESGSLTITSLSESGSGSVNIGDTYSGNVTGSFSYNPSFSDLARFRTWAVVSGTAYVYFISDVRNRITASLESVSDSGAKVRYLCKGDDGVFYPCYCVTFNYFGEKVASLSQLPNGITVDFAPGSLSQDEESGKWSVDPLYHGVWFSDQSPSLNLSPLTDTENLKWLANPVFGESAFVLNFLDSINSTLVTINDNLVSLTASMQQSISNQTSAFQNMDAQAQPQPSSDELMDYFADSSVFDAPNTDSVFTGDAEHIFSTGHIYEGVSWWTSKFNELVNDNAILVSYITTMLTIGLAVLIIGRKVGNV